MITDLKPYPEYKDSGVPWLGDVPKHWEMSRIKNHIKEIDTRSKNGEEVLLSMTRSKGIIKYRERSQKPPSAKSLIGYKTCHDNQMVMNRMQAWSGMFYAANQTGIISPDYAVFDIMPDDNVHFLCNLFRSPIMIKQFSVESKGIGSGFNRLYSDKLGAIPVALPNKIEQIKITNFIKYKTFQLTRFIKAKKRMIELLKEQKQVIINDAVTGKVDVDTGKPYRQYKDSGVEWLGQVPDGWEVIRVKSISRIRYGLGQPPKEKEDGLSLIRATNVDHGKIVIKDLLKIDFNDVPSSRDAILQEGEIIVVRSGAYTADSAIIPNEYAGSIAGYDMVMTIKKAIPEYVALALLSKYLRDDQLIPSSMRAAQPHLNKEELGSSFILLPPNDEQWEIVQATESKMNSLDIVISRTEREIALMQEYRTRLISDVVTGKIDVRDIKIPDISGIDDTIDESIEEPEGEEKLETAEGEE